MLINFCVLAIYVYSMVIVSRIKRDHIHILHFPKHVYESSVGQKAELMHLGIHYS